MVLLSVRYVHNYGRCLKLKRQKAIRKIQNLLVVGLLLLTFIVALESLFVEGCKPIYSPGETVEIYDAIETIGSGADCNISIYQNITLISSGVMTRTDLAYNYTVGLLNKSQYIANIECNLTSSTFLGECKFEVAEDEKVYIAIGIVLIFIMALLLYFGNEFKILFFDFEYNKGESKVSVPMLKYLFWVATGWLGMALINVAIVANSNDNAGLTGTLGVFFKSYLWLMYILSAFWLLAIIFYVLQLIAGLGKELKI